MNEFSGENHKERYTNTEKMLKECDRIARKVMEYEYKHSIIVNHQKALKNWKITMLINKFFIGTFIVIFLISGLLIYMNKIGPVSYFITIIISGLVLIFAKKIVEIKISKIGNFKNDFRFFI